MDVFDVTFLDPSQTAGAFHFSLNYFQLRLLTKRLGFGGSLHNANEKVVDSCAGVVRLAEVEIIFFALGLQHTIGR